jgi:hypothetical protein
MVGAGAQDSHQAILLIEIEESARGTSPKTILGDVFNVWLATAIHCHKKIYDLNGAKLWIVVFEPNDSKSKQYQGLQFYLDKLREPVQTELHGIVRIATTEIISVRNGQGSLVNAVISKMKRELPDIFLASP